MKLPMLMDLQKPVVFVSYFIRQTQTNLSQHTIQNIVTLLTKFILAKQSSLELQND